MLNRTRNLLLFLVLAGGAGGTWFLSKPRAPGVEVRTRSAPPSRSFLLVDAEIYTTDSEGRIQFRIQADRIEQQEHADDLTIDSIRVLYERDSDVNWDVSAARGIASGDLAMLELLDDIELTLSPGNNESQIIFRTDHVTLNADENRIETESMVSISQGQRTLTGRGLHADLGSDAWDCCIPAVLASAP